MTKKNETAEENIKHSIQCHTQHIEELYGYIRRLENHIEDLESDYRRMFKEQEECVKKLESKLETYILAHRTTAHDYIDKRIGQLEQQIGNLCQKLNVTCSDFIYGKPIHEVISDLDKELSQYKSESYERMVNLEFAVRELRDRLSSPDIECEEEKPLTFGELELGDKFIIDDGSSNKYIKLKSIDNLTNLACNLDSFECLELWGRVKVQKIVLSDDIEVMKHED